MKRIYAHTIHGTIVYLPTWMVDFYGFHVGKYTIVPWIVWDIKYPKYLNSSQELTWVVYLQSQSTTMARCLGTTIYLLGIIMVLPQNQTKNKQFSGCTSFFDKDFKLQPFWGCDKGLHPSRSATFFSFLRFSAPDIWWLISLNHFSYNQIEMERIISVGHNHSWNDLALKFWPFRRTDKNTRTVCFCLV